MSKNTPEETPVVESTEETESLWTKVKNNRYARFAATFTGGIALGAVAVLALDREDSLDEVEEDLEEVSEETPEDN